MRGLAVVDNDLVLFGGSYYTMSGTARIKQDLNFALRDDYGADINHPFWGSTLRRYLGQPITEAMRQQIISEVQRVLANYISVQADQVNQAITNGVRGTLDTTDVVSEVVSVDVVPVQDHFRVLVELRTMAGQSISLTRTVSV